MFADPRQQIVRYSSKTNRTELLAPSGYWLIQQHRAHPMARAVYDEMPVAEFREVFSSRVFPVITQRETLFEDGDVEITTEDVTRAINTAKKRVGKEFVEMLLAEPEE